MALPMWDAQSQAARPRSDMPEKESRLVDSMRPNFFDQVLGQDHLVGPFGSLRRFSKSESFSCFCLVGPPGSGKTTIVQALANWISYRLVCMSISGTNMHELQRLLDEARHEKRYGRSTLILVKFLFRLSKQEQQQLVPYVKSKEVVICLSMVNNPYSLIIPDLLAYFPIFSTNKLQLCHLKKIVKRAMNDKEQGVLRKHHESLVADVKIEKNGRDFLILAADGDAAVVLNVLDIAVSEAIFKHNMSMAQASGAAAMRKTSAKGIMEKLRELASDDYSRPFKKFQYGIEISDESKPLVSSRKIEIGLELSRGNAMVPQYEKPSITVTLADIQEALYRSRICCREDASKTDDSENRLCDALTKAMNESDVNTAIYWLARMLEDGINPIYLAKMLVNYASEHVGLADPQALSQAMSCYLACQNLSDMDCSTYLALCVAYLTSASKSNTVHQAIVCARTLVRGLTLKDTGQKAADSSSSVQGNGDGG